ncbi:MAG: DUF1648 domain-containing protein [Dehalococcoidia bacterium]|nr:MAG: DUF1648 domain-containing protein [Dehalococcoidia bacterium]
MALILTLTAIFLLALSGIAIWYFLHSRHLAQGGKVAKKGAEGLPFRWRYIIVPLVILSLAIILTAFFYHRLPAEVAYRFQADGSPDRWLARETITLWMLIAQLCLTLLAGAVVWGVVKLGILPRQTEDAWIEPPKLLSLMGNMIGLPQLIIGFAMLDIFSYNSYQTHIMPIWLFALIVMGVGGIILGFFFTLAIQRAWKAIK